MVICCHICTLFFFLSKVSIDIVFFFKLLQFALVV